MKKVTILLLTIILMAGCEEGTVSGNYTQDVCDCYKNANSMAVTDPKRTEAQNDCVKKQGDVWKKLKDDQKKLDEFNKMISDCGAKNIN